MANVLPLRDRASAGVLLADQIRIAREPWDLVLALPRGGVVVAYEIAMALHCPLDVFVVRKVGAPDEPELALGALAETGLLEINQRVKQELQVSQTELREAVDLERGAITRQIRDFRGDRPRATVQGRSVLVVDDGIATGATTLAAMRALRAQQPERLGLAVPVCPARVLTGFQRETDRLFVLATPQPFNSVGSWYEDFRQISSDEVVALLDAARRAN